MADTGKGFFDTLVNTLITQGVTQGLGFIGGQADSDAAADLANQNNAASLEIANLKEEGALERLLKQLAAQQAVAELNAQTTREGIAAQSRTAGFNNLLRGILEGRAQEGRAFQTLANAGRF